MVSLSSPYFSNNHNLYFSKSELSKILNCYSIGVSNGNWKDYSLNFKTNEAVFSFYKHTLTSPDCVLKKYREIFKGRRGGKVPKRGTGVRRRPCLFFPYPFTYYLKQAPQAPQAVRHGWKNHFPEPPAKLIHAGPTRPDPLPNRTPNIIVEISHLRKTGNNIVGPI